MPVKTYVPGVFGVAADCVGGDGRDVVGGTTGIVTLRSVAKLTNLRLDEFLALRNIKGHLCLL